MYCVLRFTASSTVPLKYHLEAIAIALGNAHSLERSYVTRNSPIDILGEIANYNVYEILYAYIVFKIYKLSPCFSII